MAWIRAGLEYQGFYTMAILALAVAMQRRVSLWFYWNGALLALDTVLFSSSLYCLALSHLKVWGLCHAGWRNMFPDRLGIDVDWRFASEEKG